MPPPATAQGTLGATAAVLAELLHPGRDPDEADEILARLLFCTHHTLPDPPVSAAARLSALPSGDAVDRVSRLPDALLRSIVSLLPVKDAARTAALSRRWRGVWRSAPLVLADADLSPSPAAPALSRVLEAHPGPFRCVHPTGSCTEESRHLLGPWLQLLAAKAVQELVLVNRRRPLDVVLPATFLRTATLTRLHLCFWKFPSTAGLPPGVSFPNLRELGLYSVVVEGRDLDFMLDRSPVLETLCLEGNLFTLRLRLVSQSLRCVQIIGSFLEEIFVVNAPLLERLINLEGWTHEAGCTKVKIGHAPKLQLLAYLQLDTRNHVLEIGNTIIKAGTKVSPRTMVTSVTVLALEVRFGVRNDAKMIPSVLGCFPNVETLYIKSGQPDQSTGKLNQKFWHDSGAIECIRSRIKRLIFHDFQGGRSELAFLKYFVESALMLKQVVILLSTGSTLPAEEVHSKMANVKRAGEISIALVTGYSELQGRYKRGSEFSLGELFSLMKFPCANY
ncbi:hypothetical protein CFC21_107425 [Triticum aestivum]|uniref:F-box domain-containing protein n=2 Tax=Triticum aestivum TaxID=4565 RepID=A0A3B6TE01_WHEAT|nr:F-box/LRR-repeat protein At3g26922-like [Triticum aestivum]KAF7106706.1 hypothetical protein CFC21_107425 [Triticum aestivum]